LLLQFRVNVVRDRIIRPARHRSSRMRDCPRDVVGAIGAGCKHEMRGHLIPGRACSGQQRFGFASRANEIAGSQALPRALDPR
jgi:hypothetical protein